jgi:hypothetical protein
VQISVVRSRQVVAIVPLKKPIIAYFDWFLIFYNPLVTTSVDELWSAVLGNYPRQAEF